MEHKINVIELINIFAVSNVIIKYSNTTEPKTINSAKTHKFFIKSRHIFVVSLKFVKHEATSTNINFKYTIFMCPKMPFTISTKQWRILFKLGVNLCKISFIGCMKFRRNALFNSVLKICFNNHKLSFL